MIILITQLVYRSSPFVHKKCPSRAAQKYSKEELQYENLCFYRQMFQNVWSSVWAHWNWFFKQWKGVIFFDKLLSKWSSVGLATAKRSVSSRLPSVNCEKGRGFSDDLERYFLEIRGNPLMVSFRD